MPLVHTGQFTWVLDMAFDEESNRTRQGWSDDYLLKIIGGI